MTPRDAVLQGQPVKKLHGDERLPVLLADVMNRANVGVVQGGSGSCFATETLQGLRVLRDLVGEKLQGDETMQPGVLSFIDHAHAPAAELAHYAIMGDRSAN